MTIQRLMIISILFAIASAVPLLSRADEICSDDSPQNIPGGTPFLLKSQVTIPNGSPSVTIRLSASVTCNILTHHTDEHHPRQIDPRDLSLRGVSIYSAEERNLIFYLNDKTLSYLFCYFAKEIPLTIESIKKQLLPTLELKLQTVPPEVCHAPVKALNLADQKDRDQRLAAREDNDSPGTKPGAGPQPLPARAPAPKATTERVL